MELAALLLVPEASMKRYISSGKFAGPVKLMLTQMERMFLRGAVNDTAEGKVVPLHLLALQDRVDCPVCGKEMT